MGTNFESRLSECVFCDVIANRVPRKVRYQDNELIVFENALDWVPIMYIIAPKVHLTQSEFWCSSLFLNATRVAVQIGESDAVNGFRLVSNFGDDAMQSQPHGHLHLLGGDHLGLYVDFPDKSEFLLKIYGQSAYDPKKFRALND